MPPESPDSPDSKEKEEQPAVKLVASSGFSVPEDMAISTPNPDGSGNLIYPQAQPEPKE